MNDTIERTRRLLEYENCAAVVSRDEEHMVIALSNSIEESTLDAEAAKAVTELSEGQE